MAFPWYGGKYSHLQWLLPLLPENVNAYCEAFGGSAAVLLNRPPAPVETYNDVDGDLVRFFRVLRERPEDLISAIALTPFSREEFAQACAPDSGLSDLEQARRFFVRARQVRTGLAQTASAGRWSFERQNSRRGMSGSVSRWQGTVRQLDAVAARLLRVQFENRPALQIIEQYDTPSTLHYLDPPYLHGTRGDTRAYAQEMNDDDHRALAEVANHAEGLVAVSGYKHELMREFYPSTRWRMITATAKWAHSAKAHRTEGLWVNYDPATGKRLKRRH